MHIARECAGALHGTCNYCPLSHTRRKEEAAASALRGQVPKAQNEPGCLEIGAYADLVAGDRRCADTWRTTYLNSSTVANGSAEPGRNLLSVNLVSFPG